MLGALLWSVAWGQDPALDSVNRALAACAQQPIHPLPGLTVEQRQDLLKGEVVRILDRHDKGPSAAVGMALLKAPLDKLWIATQDWHANIDPDLTELIVERIERDHMIWYGHLNLPAPLRDRHWVVRSNNNHAMAARTRDACWEHVWDLIPEGLPMVRDRVIETAPGGLGARDLDRSVFTPMNEGSWFMAPVDGDRVFVAYMARSEVAGWIPDWLVTQLAMSRLETVLRSLEKRALTWSEAHYRVGHPPVYGGDGAPVTPWPRASAAEPAGSDDES